jgi:thiamine kinase-like enzyme
VKGKSGNSLTGIVNNKGTEVFVKIFSPSRIYYFYRELYNIKFIASFPGTRLVPELKYADRKNLKLHYDLHRPATKSNSTIYHYLDAVRELNSHFDDIIMNSGYTLLAKEAFTDISQLFEQVNFRILKLEELGNDVVTKVCSMLKCEISELRKLLYGNEIASNLCFSPADSGMHNSVVDSDGKLKFVDLEYAGLDSPIKQMMDLILHPKNQEFSEEMNLVLEYFLSHRINDRDHIKLHLLGSIFALKWAIICLNEFLPDKWELRIRSDSTRSERKQEILKRQIKKSMLYYNVAVEMRIRGSICIKLIQSEKDLLSSAY